MNQFCCMQFVFYRLSPLTILFRTYIKNVSSLVFTPLYIIKYCQLLIFCGIQIGNIFRFFKDSIMKEGTSL